MSLDRFIKHILDALFPIFCLGCECHGTWFCDRCRKKLRLRQEHQCPACRTRITPFGRLCTACSDHFSLDGIFSASYYEIPLLSHALHTYKYRFVKDLSVPLAELLADALDRTDLPLPDVLMPVPLHKRRLRFRGFNQSALIAHSLAQTITPGLPLPILEDTLLRIRSTKPQMKTRSRKERLGNLRGAFAIDRIKRKDLHNKNIWLIDDVATTGATLEECAKILKKAGARSVFGIVVAS